MITVKREITGAEILDLRHSVGWMAAISTEQYEKAIAHSMACAAVYSDDQIVGCGRIVGDFACKGKLTDIIVRPGYQKKGIGRIIVNELLQQLKEQLEGPFELEACPTDGNTPFYASCGFYVNHDPSVSLWVYPQEK